MSKYKIQKNEAGREMRMGSIVLQLVRGEKAGRIGYLSF